MIPDHETVVAFSKSWGLFYIIGMAVIATVYAYWPSNKKKFDHAKQAVLRKEDHP